MHTPNEIAEKKFDKVMLWGYDLNAVDSFIESVSSDYAQLYKENITLKNKMKVLVSKIEEYRAVDESMRQALLNARSLAEEMTNNAQSQAETRLAQAEAEVNRRLAEVDSEIERRREKAEGELNAQLTALKERIATEEMRLETAKTNVQAFIDKAMALYRSELDGLSTIREQEFNYEIASPNYVASTSDTTQTEPVTESENAESSDDEASGNMIPDTVSLPDLPPVPTATPSAVRSYQSRTSVYETDSSESNGELPRRRIEDVVAARRAAMPKQPSNYDDDGEETIVLTPKPRFEFNDLRFGENYDPNEN